MNNTTNQLLLMEPTEIEQLLKARSTIDEIAQKRGFVSRVSSHQTVHRRNGSNGHQPHKAKMSQSVRDKISVGMKRLWAQRRRKAKKSEAAAPA